MKLLWKKWSLLLLALVVFLGVTMSLEAAEADIAGGIVYESYGQLLWKIDKDGHLTVEGWGDLSQNNREEEKRIPWYKYREQIVSAEINVERMRDASYLFYDCPNLKSVDLKNFQMNETINMMHMFEECHQLEQIDFGDIDSGKVQNMSYMFYECEMLEHLDVSSWNTKNVTTMEGMFAFCKKLKQLDVSHFDTGRVTNMDGMFADCYQLTELDISNWDTQNVTTLNSMFRSCASLAELDVSNFNLRKANNLGYVFFGCKLLTELDVSNFHISNVWNVTSMFQGCEGLTYLNLSTFDFDGGVHAEDFLEGCYGLRTIETPLNISNRIDLPGGSSEEGWYGPDGTKYWKFGELGNKSVTLRRLSKDGFWDVYPEEWYASNVEYVYEKGLMTGNGKLFKPNEPITRAMVVQTLYNMEGRPKITDFKACIELKDVYGDWYMDAVCWAYNEGITTGYDDTKTFETDKSVTREELAAFLYRYANYKGYNTSQIGELSGLQHVDMVSPYAKNAVNWAVGAGLISGIEIKQYGVVIAKDLAPQGTATRAQMAAILQRFCLAHKPLVKFKWNGHFYAVLDNCQTWEGAKAYCESLGGHLAIINSKEENDALYAFIKERGYTSAYFGLSDKAEEGTWTWVNADASDYINWNAEEPGGGAAENYAMFFYLYEDGTWNDGAFLENVYDGGNAYICEWE